MARIKKKNRVELRSPYSYRPGNSILHRLPAWIKLLALLLMSTAAFIAGFPALAAALVVIVAGAVASGVRPWELLRGFKNLFIMILLIFFLRSVAYDPFRFDREGCMEALRFAGVILVSFTAASLLFSVTTMGELNESLGAIEKALCRPLVLLLRKGESPWARRLAYRLERPRFSLGISLMLGFLPRFFEVWESVTLAYQARSGKKGLSLMLTVIPLVMERMIGKAAETAAALESRGLGL
jgi:energy-coupling factor transporter transmembrane protein EcfT